MFENKTKGFGFWPRINAVMTDADHDARQRLLTAAATIFAQRGFQSATVRDIVYRANMNLAAVSYHFGGKAALYQAVLSHMLTQPAVDREAADPAATPAQRLRQLIAAIVFPAETSTVRDKILAWETLSPTGFLKPELHMGGLLEELEPVMRDLGGLTDAGEIRLRAVWLMGQCLLFSRLSNWILPANEPPSDVVDRLLSLCLNGLMAG